ncbi:Transcriptional regulator domain-containing protein [Sesbania bispinosa]|nr:Transcriptional regulator domain-containing protein [Sesbania bispinosa]
MRRENEGTRGQRKKQDAMAAGRATAAGALCDDGEEDWTAAVATRPCLNVEEDPVAVLDGEDSGCEGEGRGSPTRFLECAAAVEFAASRRRFRGLFCEERWEPMAEGGYNRGLWSTWRRKELAYLIHLCLTWYSQWTIAVAAAIHGWRLPAHGGGWKTVMRLIGESSTAARLKSEARTMGGQ